MPTVLQVHVDKWKDCKQCPLSQNRTSVVITRGKIPCDILFVGEAPGHSEDLLRLPFVGPAGKLLDGIIASVWTDKKIRWAFTNLVCCIPLEEGENRKTERPDDKDIKACKPRLEEFIRIANPRAIVCVGQLAKDWLDRGYRHSVKIDPSIKVIDIVHPANILRSNLAQQGLAIRRCEVALENLVGE